MASIEKEPLFRRNSPCNDSTIYFYNSFLAVSVFLALTLLHIKHSARL